MRPNSFFILRFHSNYSQYLSAANDTLILYGKNKVHKKAHMHVFVTCARNYDSCFCLVVSFDGK